MRAKSIIIGIDGYLYLQRESIEQRRGEVTDRLLEYLKEAFAENSIDGKTELCGGWLGGGCGSEDPSTWTSWSVEQMARMLEKQNIPFEFGETEVSYLGI